MSLPPRLSWDVVREHPTKPTSACSLEADGRSVAQGAGRPTTRGASAAGASTGAGGLTGAATVPRLRAPRGASTTGSAGGASAGTCWEDLGDHQGSSRGVIGGNPRGDDYGPGRPGGKSLFMV